MSGSTVARTLSRSASSPVTTRGPALLGVQDLGAHRAGRLPALGKPERRGADRPGPGLNGQHEHRAGTLPPVGHDPAEGVALELRSCSSSPAATRASSLSDGSTCRAAAGRLGRTRRPRGRAPRCRLGIRGGFERRHDHLAIERCAPADRPAAAPRCPPTPGEASCVCAWVSATICGRRRTPSSQAAKVDFRLGQAQSTRPGRAAATRQRPRRRRGTPACRPPSAPPRSAPGPAPARAGGQRRRSAPP